MQFFGIVQRDGPNMTIPVGYNKFTVARWTAKARTRHGNVAFVVHVVLCFVFLESGSREADWMKMHIWWRKSCQPLL